jgi:hypothetical protein
VESGRGGPEKPHDALLSDADITQMEERATKLLAFMKSTVTELKNIRQINKGDPART